MPIVCKISLCFKRYLNCFYNVNGKNPFLTVKLGINSLKVTDTLNAMLVYCNNVRPSGQGHCQTRVSTVQCSENTR